MKTLQRLRNRMRFLNKWIFNQVILKFAGASYSPVSVIRHLGRRSGRAYATPVIMVPSGDRFVFALPYGADVDWYRNVLAAGQATVVWRGQQYLVENPEPLAVPKDLPRLPFIFRMILPIVGAQLFRQMKSTKVIVVSRPEHQQDMAIE